MKALPFLCSVSLKLYIFFNTYLICDNYSVHKVVKQLENYLEEIFMSKLLRELTCYINYIKKIEWLTILSYIF